MAQPDETVTDPTSPFVLVRRQDVAGLTLTEARYPREVAEPTHSHEHAYFEVVLKGAYTEHERRGTQEHPALSLAFEPVKEPHSARIHPGGLHNLRIELQPEWLQRIDDSLPAPHPQCLSRSSLFTQGTLPWLGTRLYEEWRRMDLLSSLAIEGLVLEMIAETVRSQAPTLDPRSPRWLNEVMDLLRAEFAEPLTLQYIAQVVGIHPVYLARMFRQRHRCTVGEYVRRLRIEYACKELVTTDVPLADIALAAGFADQSHFSKVFKRLVGLSPAAFRKRSLGSPQTEKILVHPET